MNLLSNIKKIFITLMFSSFLVANLFAAAPTGTGATLNSTTDGSTVTITVTVTDAATFASSGNATADGTDILAISYAGLNPTSATIDNATTLTLTYSLQDIGTGKSGGDLVINASTINDATPTPNALITIVDTSITDAALPVVFKAGFAGDNEVVVAFSEPIDTSSVAAADFSNITKDGSISLAIDTVYAASPFTGGLAFDSTYNAVILRLSTSLGDGALNAGTIDVAGVNDIASNTMATTTAIALGDMQEPKTMGVTITTTAQGVIVSGDTIVINFSEVLASSSLVNIQNAVNNLFVIGDETATVTTSDSLTYTITFTDGTNTTVSIDISTEKVLNFAVSTISDVNNNTNSNIISFSILQAPPLALPLITEFDIDNDAKYSEGDKIYIQFAIDLNIAEINATTSGVLTSVLVDNSKTFGTGASVIAAPLGADVSVMNGFLATTNDGTVANTFMLTLGTGTDLATGDNITIASSSITALSSDITFPLLAVANVADLGVQVADIRAQLTAATDMPADLRDTIEALLVQAETLLVADPLDETALVAKLAEINAVTATIGNEDIYLYGTNASTISGTITLPATPTAGWTSEANCFDTTTFMPLSTCNAVFVDLKSKNGEWLGSAMVNGADGTYTIYFRELAASETIDALLEINMHIDGVEEHLFYDFGSDKAIAGGDDTLKSSMDVTWVETSTGSGIWAPDVKTLTITTPSTPPLALTLDFDISSLDANKFVVDGTVKVPADFTPGEKFNTDGTWAGFSMVNLTAIDKDTGAMYWTEIGRTETSVGNSTYPFKFKLPNSTANYIIKIEKFSDNNGVTDWLEMYLNDGGDNAFAGTADSLVGSTGIQWNETSSNSGIWVPDTAKTGFFAISANVTGIAIDITTFGSNFYKIAGAVTPPTSFDMSSFQNNMNVDVLDAKTGWWLGGSPVICDAAGANCTYSVVLGSALNDYDGSGNGGYIVKVYQNHWDDTNWENSWFKALYYDFGVDKAFGGSDDSILDEIDVRWNESSDLDPNGFPYWKPDVNPLHIASGTAVSAVPAIDISFASYTAPTTYTISGSISGIDANAKWININIYDPLSYTGTGAEVNADGSFSIQNVKAGKYILELNYDVDNAGVFKHYNYIIADNDGDFTSGTSAIDGMDIKWIPYDSSGNSLESGTFDPTFDWSTVSYWAPEETASQKVLLNVSADVTVASVTVTQASLYNLTANLSATGLADGLNVNFNLFVPNEPIGRWESVTSSSGASATLKDLKSRTDYQLQIWVDGLGEFWYDGTNLVSDVYWVGKQNGSTCDDWKNNIMTCNYNDFTNPVVWGPNITGFAISADTTLSLTLPNDRSQVTATLSLGATYASKTVYVNMWQNNGSNYAWEEYITDSSGNVAVSLSVKQGTSYRMEVYIPDTFEGYVVDLGTDNSGTPAQGVVGGGDDSLISNQNSWDTSGAWGPKSSTLIDASADVALGTLAIPSLNTIGISIANLAVDTSSNISEDVWIGFQDTSTNEWYGNGNANWSDWQNPTFSNTLVTKVPNGTYYIHVYPMEHKAGMVDENGDGVGNDAITVTGGTPDTVSIDFTASATTVWDTTIADTVTVANDTNISFTLKTLASLQSISGTITLANDANETGWICATSSTDGRCSEVDINGAYSINGLSQSGTDTYVLDYWANNGETFRDTATFVDTSNNVTKDINIAGVTLVTISGTVADNNTATIPTEVVLLDVASDNSWVVMDAIAIDSNWDGSSLAFLFDNLPPALGTNHYEVAVGSSAVTAGTGVTTYTVNDALQAGNVATTTSVADDTTITVTTN